MLKKNQIQSVAMKARNGKPSSRPTSCIYNRAAAHAPSYVIAKKRKYNKRRRRKQNRDAPSDYVQRINISVVTTLDLDITYLCASVSDPEKFCEYFGLEYTSTQWQGNIFWFTRAKSPAKIIKDSPKKISLRKAYSIYHRKIQNRLFKLLRQLRYLQCPQRSENGKLKSPRFKFVFKSDLPWMAPVVFNRAKLRPLPLRKLHQKNAYSLTPNKAGYISKHKIRKYNNNPPVDLWRGSARYAPDKHAVGIGKGIRFILHSFNTRYEASTVKNLDFLVPPDMDTDDTSFVLPALASKTKKLNRSERKALLHYRKFQKHKQAVRFQLKNNPESTKVIAITTFIQAQIDAYRESLQPNKVNKWPKWLSKLSTYLRNVVGDMPALRMPSYSQHPNGDLDSEEDIKPDIRYAPAVPIVSRTCLASVQRRIQHNQSVSTQHERKMSNWNDQNLQPDIAAPNNTTESYWVKLKQNAKTFFVLPELLPNVSLSPISGNGGLGQMLSTK